MVRKSLDTATPQARPPRVLLTYPLESGAAKEERELPFVVGVLASVSGDAPRASLALKNRRFLAIDRNNFDEVVARVAPRVTCVVTDHALEAPTTVDLTFSRLADFDPDAVALRVPAVAVLLDERSRASSEPPSGERDQRIARLESMIDVQLSAVLHTDAFRRLEATWRGLHYLVTETNTSAALKLCLLDVSKLELLEDAERAAQPEHTVLFRKIYEEGYGTFGGEPLGLLIGDFEFGPSAGDVGLLEKLAQVAAAAHAPFIAAASPALLKLASFRELALPRDLAALAYATELARWRAFRDLDAARYACLTVPRVLLRRPYTRQESVAFRFEERINSQDDLLWGTSAYALGACVTNAFAKYSWCAAIQGLEGGGLVRGLPTVPLTMSDGEGQARLTEVFLTDDRQRELLQLGLTPLVTVEGRDCAAFLSVPSCHKPRLHQSETADANSRLWAQLQYVLAGSRFGHYLRCIMRDKVTVSITRGQCEKTLQRWLEQYVLREGDISVEQKARYPLAEAQVSVESVPGKPSGYRAVAYLRPHFQLDDLTLSLRLTVELPTVVP